VPVLYINFELPRWAIVARLRALCAARSECQGWEETLHLWNLRGHQGDLTLLRTQLEGVLGRFEFGLIILDPGSRFAPDFILLRRIGLLTKQAPLPPAEAGKGPRVAPFAGRCGCRDAAAWSCVCQGKEHNWAMKLNIWMLVGAVLLARAEAQDGSPSLIRSVEVATPLTAPADGTYWMQARPAVVKGGAAGLRVVITLQKVERVGTHIYHGLEAIWTDDLGRTWSGPEPLKSVDRIARTNGLLEAPVDMTPQMHQRTGKLLVTGATFWQDPQRHRDVPNGPSDTAYAVYDPKTSEWNPWARLAMSAEQKFHFARAGCSQRVDLPDGDVLLPIYFRRQGSDQSFATVVRCTFDGVNLRYAEHGTELTVTNANPKSRKGVHEPSLAQFGGKYFLTLRNDERGYVAASSDGLRFGEPQPWRFDDGAELGSYNTQQHWITHSEGLFLGYTRRGADNDRVFRHRAPLFVARVDPARLVVERATERILLPNLGAAFGNFGVCHVTPEETWVVDCLVDAPAGTNNLFVAKIHWSRPNRLVGK
jgi:hypothetical protein